MLDDAGAVEKVVVRPWVAQAFEAVAAVIDNNGSYHAEGGNRTHTPVKERDFESRASASSATPAREKV